MHVIPLEALRGVQGRQRDGTQRRLVVRPRAGCQVVREPTEGGSLRCFLSQPQDRGAGLPRVAQRSPGRRRLVGQAQRSQHIAHRVGEPALDRSDGCTAKRHDGLPHLGQVEEPLAAEHRGGEAGIRQCGHELGRLGVRAVQHGDPPRVDARGHLLRDPCCDAPRLVLVVVERGDRGRLGGTGTGARCHEVKRTGPIAHEIVRDGEDRGIRPVIRLQAHEDGIVEAVLEVQEEPSLRARERVDGLTRIADHADIPPVAEPQLEQAMLQGRDVLELVHGEVPVLLMDSARDVRLGFEHAGAREQHVFEVQLPALVLELLVRALQIGHALDRQSADALRARHRVLVDTAHR